MVSPEKIAVLTERATSRDRRDYPYAIRPKQNAVIMDFPLERRFLFLVDQLGLEPRTSRL
jgi:hypothetical protein